MIPDQPSRRRRFQFGIGTMLLLVTAIALWLGHERHWITQRHRMLEQREAIELDYQITQQATPPKAPGMLWLFGEQGIADLRVLLWSDGPTIPDGWCESQERAVRARRLFPEAGISFAVGWPAD